MFFGKFLFIKPVTVSLKPLNADEFPLMQSSAKSASGPGLLGTLRSLARGYAPALRMIPAGSFSAVVQTIWCHTPLSNPVAAWRK